MQPYKQFFNRGISLILAQIYEAGEREEIREICDGKFFYEGLYVFRQKRGVAMYYNVDDINQWPETLFKFVNANRDRIRNLIKDYYDYNERLTKAIAKKDLKDIFNVMKKLLAIIGISVNISNADSSVDEGLKRDFFDLRKQNDKVLFFAENELLNIITEKVPDHLKEYSYYFTFDEVVNGRFPSMSEILSRMEMYIMFKGRLFTGVGLEQFCQQHNIRILEDKEGLDKKEVKGMVASLGKVVGKVKLIFSINDLDKVKDGDVIVSPMTTPNFLPAIKKASAIVTDEGGVTCHASIVAREFEKPCVIGTNNASKIFSDNDLVEVDAYNGIVRRIENERL
jgi:phosphohistidine swiveling domain-containing protein